VSGAGGVQKIGVIGGGQLGRMLTLDAKRMGYTVVVLDPTEHSPCGQVADEQIVAPYDDLAAVEELGRRTDIVTYEFENIAIASVQRLEERGFSVTPRSEVLHITQNRLREKTFLRDAGVFVGDFAPVNNEAQLGSAAAEVRFPAVLKTASGGYDGKGQWLAHNMNAAHEAVRAAGQPLIFEAHVPFVKELSIIAARNRAGDIATFPVSENIHDAGILMTSIVPARISADVAERAHGIAQKIARALQIVGVFCVELFMLEDGGLLVNEIAPRPHNSGHYSMDAMPCSQYEQHIRAICGLPLAPPRLLSGAVMTNILGAGTGNTLHGVEALLAEPSIVLHVYGKRHAVARRKMGHFTVLDDDLERGIEKARAGLAKLRWR